MIQQWFDTKGNYNDGIHLLEQLTGKNSPIYRRLKNAKDNARTMAALKYELRKHLKKPLKSIVNTKIKKVTVAPPTTTEIREIAVTSLTHSNKRVTISMLDDPQMQKRYIEKNTAFLNRCRLKMQLNNLAADKESEALDISTEILRLTTLIDTIWEEIDYYVEHRKIMPKGNDFSTLSPMELLKKKQQLFQNISKRKKTITKWQNDLAYTPKDKQLALKSKINTRIEQITKLEADLQKINERINKS